MNSESIRPVVSIARPAAERAERADRAAQALPAGSLGSIELLADRVTAAVVSTDGTVLRRVEERFDSATTASRVGIEQVVADTAARCFYRTSLRGVGVASAGLVDERTGVIREIHDLPALDGFAIAASLGALLEVPVFVDHRARLQVLGDRWFGHGLGRSAFASVSTGQTLGVGILYEGHVIAPAGGRSGAHITVAAGGELCTCGNRGCWKTIATTRWLQTQAVEAGLGEVRGIRDVIAAGRTDARARDLATRYADNLAVGLSTIQHLFAPGLYIVHGDAAAGGTRFLAHIEERLRAVSGWAELAEVPWVVVAKADADDVTLLGGAGLVLSRVGLG